MKLQQGTPDALKNVQKSRQSANDDVRISNCNNEQSGEFSSGCSVNPRVPDTAMQVPSLHVCEALQQFTRRAQGSFSAPEVHYMYVYTRGLRRLNLHLWCALLQFRFPSIFLLVT